MMKQPNVFWILVDGIRAKKGKDIYGRCDVFYEFDKESVSFKNIYATAPATLMSISSILTGKFAIDLFPNFEYIHKHGMIYETYPDLLRKAGYNVVSVMRTRGGGRAAFKDCLGTLEGELPGHLQSNRECYDHYEYVMNKKFSTTKPNFIFVHIGCYKDNGYYAEKILDDLKHRDLYEDSYVMLSSDHGYIDYGKFKTLGWLKAPLVHSLYLDDDTVKANLDIKFPNNKHVKEINTQACLIDMFETLFDYLEIDGVKQPRARSLRPLIDTDSKKAMAKFDRRLLRADTRFIYQHHRTTRIQNANRTFYVLPKGRDASHISPEFKHFYDDIELETEQNLSKLVEQMYHESQLPGMQGDCVIFNYGNKAFIDEMSHLLPKKNNSAPHDLNWIQKHSFDYETVIAFVDGNNYSQYQKLDKWCKRNNLQLRMFDDHLNPIYNIKQNFWKETLKHGGLKGHPLPIKIGLYFFLVYLKYKESLDLYNSKNNYL